MRQRALLQEHATFTRAAAPANCCALPPCPHKLRTREQRIVVLVKLAQDGDVDALVGAHERAVTLVQVRPCLQ